MRREKVFKAVVFYAGLLTGISLALPWQSSAERFSIVVLPDTQFLAEKYPKVFEAQTKWIVDNREKENIIYVAHLGDLKDSPNCDNKLVPDGSGRREWDVVSDSMEVLEEPGIPYSVIPGNHDDDGEGGDPNTGPCAKTSPRTLYNGKFGPSHFADVTYPKGYYGGSFDPTNNDNNYTLFSSPGGLKFIAINLAYTSESAPPGQSILDWADNLLKANSDRMAIVTSHYILEDNIPANRDSNGSVVFGPLGRAVYDRLSSYPNLFLVLGGHRRGEGWRKEIRAGLDEVQILLSNYQDIQYPTSSNFSFENLPSTSSGGDSGFMRIMRFDTDKRQVSVVTFAPKAPELGRPNDLESTFDPPDGSSMSQTTASNFSFQFSIPVAVPPAPSNLRTILN